MYFIGNVESATSVRAEHVTQMQHVARQTVSHDIVSLRMLCHGLVAHCSYAPGF